MSEADFVRHKAVELIEPRGGEAVPVVYDSPHSGTLYPEDFGHVVDPFLLMHGEDRFVDDLVIDAPDHGIPLIRALFARTYIDPNREPTDLDPHLLEEDWPDELVPGLHSERGVGLIFRLIGRSVPIYGRRLGPAEVRHRVQTYWQAYQDCLQERIDEAHARHGQVWHVDWHSMQAVGNELSPDPGIARKDFVLGDLDGTSCAAEFTDFVADALRGLGYSVAVNDPYAGAYIVRRHGRPREGRHSLQVEINRGLYMDAESLDPTGGLEELRKSLARFAAELAAWAAER